MKVLFGAALGAAALMLVGTSAMTPAAAASKTTGVSQQAGTENVKTIDEFSSQRRRYRRGYYYGGPRYYRPYGYGNPYGGYYGNPYRGGYGYGPGYYSRPGISFGFGF